MSNDIFMEVPFLLVIVCMLTTVSASIGCGMMRRVSMKKSILLDVPNQRSSHQKPMPRGGGAPMAVASIIAIAFIGLVRGHLVPQNWVLAICGGGSAIALVGWLDDRSGLSAAKRFFVHVIAAAWAVNWLVPEETALIYKFLAGFWVAWSINFYNFMDGVDGLAGAEAIFIGLGAGYLAGRVGTQPTLAINWILASAALGFLFWNWPPARIFMGDAGSGFLGYAFGCLAIGSGPGWNAGFMTYFLLLALFWGDASITLLKRIFRGEKFWEAHNQHFYQQAIKKGYSHHEVTLFFVTANMVLFVIAAWFAGIGKL
jgi:Fuc2NAc and GlcNAc transferase